MISVCWISHFPFIYRWGKKKKWCQKNSLLIWKIWFEKSWIHGNHWFTPHHTHVVPLTCRLENSRVALTVPRSKGLHHTVDLLRLAGQAETPQELPAITRRRVRTMQLTVEIIIPPSCSIFELIAPLTVVLGRGLGLQIRAAPQKPEAPWCWSRPWRKQ